MSYALSFSVANTVFSKNIQPVLTPNATQRTNWSVRFRSNLAAGSEKQNRKLQMIGVDIQQVQIIASMQLTRKPYDIVDLHNDTMRENIAVWKSIVDRLKGPCKLSRDSHDCKIGARKLRLSVNTAFWKGQSPRGTDCLQRYWQLSAVNHLLVYVGRSEVVLKGGDETSESGGKGKWGADCSELHWGEVTWILVKWNEMIYLLKCVYCVRFVVMQLCVCSVLYVVSLLFVVM